MNKLILAAMGAATFICAAQTRPAPAPKPKLVVMIVVDQFRADYLWRFRPDGQYAAIMASAKNLRKPG